MTDADALLAAILANPDDHSAKLVWLDAFQERHGETPWVQATREFLAECGKRRRFITRRNLAELHQVDLPPNDSGSDRRALPGWREWLGGGVAWEDMRSRHVESWVRAGLLPGKWWLLCPSLTALITREASWRRKSATVELWLRPNPEPPHYQRTEYSARLTFARGFLARVEFRTWEAADALLPAILADQPFVEAGIWGAIGDVGSFGTYIRESMCGPAWSLVEGADSILEVNTEHHKVFSENASLARTNARARRALSAALRRRALITAAASPVPSA